MEARELRYGNLFQLVEGGNVFKFLYLTRAYKDYDFKEWRIVVENGMPERPIKLDFAEGIPLTKRWLVKLGALKREDGIYSWHYGDHENECTDVFQIDIDELCGFRYRPTYHSEWLCKTPLEHVHQLQNLYFALTGEELTLKS